MGLVEKGILDDKKVYVSLVLSRIYLLSSVDPFYYSLLVYPLYLAIGTLR